MFISKRVNGLSKLKSRSQATVKQNMGQLSQLWNIVCLDRMVGQHFNSCSCPEKTQLESANTPSLTPRSLPQCALCTALLMYCWRGERWCLAPRRLCQRELMWLAKVWGGMRAGPTLYNVPQAHILYPQAPWPQKLSLDLCFSPLFPFGRIPSALSHSLHVRGCLGEGQSATYSCTSHPVNFDCGDF